MQLLSKIDINLAFLTFLYKIGIKGFKKFQQKIKLSPVGIELKTPTIYGLDAYSTQPPRHVLNRKSSK